MLGSVSPSKSRYYATFARRTTGRLRKRHAFHAAAAANQTKTAVQAPDRTASIATTQPIAFTKPQAP